MHLHEKKHSLAKVYEGILRTGVEELTIRDYPSTLAMGLLVDKVAGEVYENLIQVGQTNAKFYREFLQIKKEYFGLTKFYATDASLKIVQPPKHKFTVDEAV